MCDIVLFLEMMRKSTFSIRLPLTLLLVICKSTHVSSDFCGTFFPAITPQPVTGDALVSISDFIVSDVDLDGDTDVVVGSSDEVSWFEVLLLHDVCLKSFSRMLFKTHVCLCRLFINKNLCGFFEFFAEMSLVTSS